MLEEELAAELAAFGRHGLARRLDDRADRTASSDFVTNDYLGLSRDPAVIAAAHAALDEAGAGARAARLLGGGSDCFARAEERAAAWLDAEAALLFPSGFQANLGVVGALAGRGDALFSDAKNHASLIDGCRLARATTHVFRHGDLDELARQLRQAAGARRRIVVVETLFGMDGDLAPLAELHELCERHDASLLLDEAHAIGLLGPRGAGAWAALRRDAKGARRVVARVITGGKALGVAGAFVVGSRVVRDTLLQQARSFLFTTAPAPVIGGALAAAIERCATMESERAAALANARRLAAALQRPVPAGAIVPIVVGEAAATVALKVELARAGFAVGAVRPPTVAEGASQLRLVAHAFNTSDEVDRLAAAITARLPKSVAIPKTASTSPLTPSLALSRAPTLFVVGTDTGIGKTVASALLLRAARTVGAIAYWKPVQTGDESDTETVRRLADAAADEIVPNRVHFERPASPHEAAAAENATIDPAALAAELERLRTRPPDQQPSPRSLRPLIIELAGGLLVPYRAGAKPFFQADWVAATPGARVVVVARSGLGTLNHTLLTLAELRRRHVEPSALLLVGEMHRENAATLREIGGVARVVEIPRFEPLDAKALAGWIETADAASRLAELFAP